MKSLTESLNAIYNWKSACRIHANPRYILTEPRVGYRMPKGEGRERK